MTRYAADLLQHAGVDVLALRGVVDLPSATDLRSMLDSLLEDTPGMVVDLADVQLLDAAGVRALVAARDRARERGVALYAVGARGVVLEVLEVAGVARELRARWDRAEAIATLTGRSRGRRAGGASRTEPRGIPRRRVPAGTGFEPDTRYGSGETGTGEPAAATDPGHAPGARLEAAKTDELVRRLLREASRLRPDDPRRQRLRDRAVEYALPYARRLAWRYHSRGEPHEDLLQVAAVGLVKAVNRYNPDKGPNFLGFATPTILGELRRHFRDSGWSMRVPRRLKDLRVELTYARTDLEQALGRHPTVADLARHVGATEQEVSETLLAARNYRPESLSTLVDDDRELGELLGGEEPAMDLVDFRESIRPVLARLTPRERRVLAMRFGADMTQSQIAAEVGTSQMQVSRLLAMMLGRFRRVLAAGDGN